MAGFIMLLQTLQCSSLLYNFPDLGFKPRGLQMQIVMLVSELEAQEILSFYSVLGRDSAAVKGYAVLSETVPYSSIQT